ncbi:MAG: phosphotransacetylase family protein [Chloroflexi bacterium]|nr:phosphotransacetylase family protein [Chloroflexota bacterium]
MGVLQVSADRPGAGKTCLIAALLTQLDQAGSKVAYWKPFSRAAEADPDVTFISQEILSDNASPAVPAPGAIPADPAELDSGPLAQSLRGTLAGLSTDATSVLIEGPDLDSSTGIDASGSDSSLALKLATLADAPIVQLFWYTNSLDPEAVLNIVEPYGDRLIGVIINGITEYRKREAEENLVKPLVSRNVPVLGTLPEDRAMLAVTVQQIADHLNGRWINEPVNTQAHVERFLIGGNIMDSGPIYFGRYANQAVITRAERPDIQLACLMEDTRCLILTGAGELSEYIKVEALQRDVPLIRVTEGTLSTAEALGGLLDQANAYSPWKIQRFSQLMAQHLDLAPLTAALG